MLKKLLIVFTFTLTYFFTGCAGRYGIPHHTVHQISEYQHLYIATARSVKLKPLTHAVASQGTFIAGEVVDLGVPKIERVGGSSQYGYYGSFHKYCILHVPIHDTSSPNEITQKIVGIHFLYPEPADHHISEGDLIVIKASSQVPDRENLIFRADFVRNLSTDWRTYKLPLTE